MTRDLAWEARSMCQRAEDAICLWQAEITRPTLAQIIAFQEAFLSIARGFEAADTAYQYCVVMGLD